MAKTTTNYGLTKPERSDQYNVDVMNGNMDKIDSTLKNLNTGSVTVSGNVTGGTITASNKFSGTLYGKVYVNAKTSTTKYNNDVTYATCAAQSLSVSTYGAYGGSGNYDVSSSTITVGNYSKISMSYPYQLYPGIYIPSSAYFTDNVPSGARTVTLSLNKTTDSGSDVNAYLYVNGSQVLVIGGRKNAGTYTGTYNVSPGDKVYIRVCNWSSYTAGHSASLSIPAKSTYYINTV